jgi:hypothetical protein
MSSRTKERRVGGRRVPGAWKALGLLLLGWLAAPGADGMVWRGGTSALLGAGTDTNPLEALNPDDRHVDGFARLESGFWIRGATTPNGSGPSFGLRWAADRYVRERIETRLISSARAGWAWRYPGKSLACSWTSYARSFPADPVRAVRRHEVQLAAERRLPSGALLRAGLQGMALESRRDGPPARRGSTLRFEIQRSDGATWTTRAGVECGVIQIDRPALRPFGDGQLAASAGDQRDRWLLASATARALGPPYFELGCGVRRVHSNSYGYSMGRLEASLLLGGILVRSLSGQVLLRAELPVYDDARVGIDVHEDVEDRAFAARNGMTLRLLRPLGQGWSADLQATWQNDESLILRDFYRKTILMAALRYSAGEPDPGGF